MIERTLFDADHLAFKDALNPFGVTPVRTVSFV